MKNRIFLLLSFMFVALCLSAQSLVFHLPDGGMSTVALPATLTISPSGDMLIIESNDTRVELQRDRILAMTYRNAKGDVNEDMNVDVADIATIIDIMAGRGDDKTPKGLEAVDLGLPSGTLWANMNVGAEKPEDYGGYYAWGETEEKEVYDWSTYLYSDGSSNKYNNAIGSEIAGTQNDVAHVKWGGSWKMPTLEQMRELLDNCTYEWTTVNGIKGGRFTGTNGKSIFIPAGGGAQEYYPDKNLEWTCGEFWASTFLGNSSYGRAYTLLFGSGNAEVRIWSSLCHGRSVRPVAAPVK